MAIRNEFMVAFAGMVGPCILSAAFGNLLPTVIWLVAFVIALVYGRERSP